MPNFTPHRCNVSPLRGEKPQNRPLSKLNTGRLALAGNDKKVKVGFLYSATYTANQNSALHNLGSGS